MRRFDWDRRRDMVTGVFVAVFTGAVATLIALWLLAAIVLGTLELARRIG